jgi:hypothetical protein
MKEGAIAAVPSVTVPVIWSVLGYSFPTGSMIVGCSPASWSVCSSLSTPLGPRPWILDGIVTGLAMLILAGWIVEHQVDLFAALGAGAAPARAAPASSRSSSGVVKVRSTPSTRRCPASPSPARDDFGAAEARQDRLSNGPPQPGEAWAGRPAVPAFVACTKQLKFARCNGPPQARVTARGGPAKVAKGDQALRHCENACRATCSRLFRDALREHAPSEHFPVIQTERGGLLVATAASSLRHP